MTESDSERQRSNRIKQILTHHGLSTEPLRDWGAQEVEEFLNKETEYTSLHGSGAYSHLAEDAGVSGAGIHGFAQAVTKRQFELEEAGEFDSGILQEIKNKWARRRTAQEEAILRKSRKS